MAWTLARPRKSASRAFRKLFSLKFVFLFREENGDITITLNGLLSSVTDTEHNGSRPVPTPRRRKHGSSPGRHRLPQRNHSQLFTTFHDDFHSNGKTRLPPEPNRYVPNRIQFRGSRKQRMMEKKTRRVLFSFSPFQLLDWA